MQPRRPLFPAFCALQFLFCGTIESRTVSPELHVQHTTAAPPSRAAAAGGGYGHRSVPADAVRKVRGRLEEAVQEEERPYETAGTYEYMVRPTAGKGSRTRVPETERRPPGADDVELIHDRYYGEGRNGDRYYRGYGAPAAGSDRYRGYGRGGPRYVDPATPVEKPRRYVGGGPTPVEKPRTAAAKPGGKDARREQVDVVVDEPGERRVVKKNEYSKKREFFDEEHVKDPAERPAEPAASSSRSQKERARSGGRADPRRKKRKRRAKKVKKHKNRRPVGGGGNNFGGSGSGSDNYAAAVASAGYGQILAVR